MREGVGRANVNRSMVLRTTLRDCLYLNWALPAPALPELPEPLRPELHPDGGQEWGFASVLLFQQVGLRSPTLPLARLSYPQLNLRWYVRDGDGLPAVYFRRMLVPAWVVPLARLVAGEPVRGGRLEYPQPSDDPEADGWTWRAGGEEGLVVTARRGAPAAGAGPDLGSWEATVRYFRERRRGYVGTGGGLRRIDTRQPDSPAWPVKVEVAGLEWVARGLGLAEGGAGELARGVHSAWLCPEMVMTFETASAEPAPEEPVRRSVPAAG